MGKKGFVKLLAFSVLVLAFLLFAFLKSQGIIEVTGYTTHTGEFQINETILSKVNILINGEIIPIVGDFHRYDTIACGVSYLGNETGVNLSLGIYSPTGDQNSPNIFNSNLISSEESCDTEINVCLIYYNATTVDYGNWGCFVKIVDTVELSNELEMVNGPPISTRNISDLSLSIDGDYPEDSNEINLNDYFRDLENDEIEYGAVGQLHIRVSIDNDGNVIFTNPEGYEGYENVKFRAHDGTNGTFSNEVSISIGSGIASDLEVCDSVWDCNWDPCVNGQRTCSYYDRNNCGDISAKPEDLIEGCDATSLSSENNNQQPIQLTGTLNLEEPIVSGVQRKLLMTGIVVFILLIVGLVGFLFYRQSKKNISKSTEESNNQFTKVDTQPAIRQNIETSNLKELNKYIESALEQGQNIQTIKADLIKVGWIQKDIDASVNYVSLKRFVKGKLESGFEKEKIITSLKAKGWKDEMINSILKELGK